MSGLGRKPGSLRDIKARLQSGHRRVQRPAGTEREYRSGGHSRSTLHRIFQELPHDRVDEAKELMMLPGYADPLPADPRAVLDFYLRLPGFARDAIRTALGGDSVSPRFL